MKSSRFICLCVVFLNACCAFHVAAEVKNPLIAGAISGLGQAKVYLLKFDANRKAVVDSAFTDGNGSFVLVNSPAITPGLYRLVIGPDFKLALPLILGKKFISFSTSHSHPMDSMVMNDKENSQYYTYLRTKDQYKKKLDLLENMLELYPNDCNTKGKDCFYRDLQQQFNSVQKELGAYTDKLMAQNRGTLVAAIVGAEQYPFLDAFETAQLRFETLKRQFFQASDFTDPALLHTDVLANKILSYMALHRNDGYTEKEQSDAFIKGLQVLQPLAAKGNAEVYQFVLRYLVDGFTQIRQQAVLDYIALNYLSANTCGIEDENIKALVQKVTDNKRTVIGAAAPEIQFDTAGTLKLTPGPGTQPVIRKLSDIKSEYTVVVFWASWCPHCLNFLPRLKQVYKEYNSKGLEVVAISLDTDAAEWLRTIDDANYNWVNYTDLKKWQGDAARAYNVTGTPCMFLLDKNKRIVAKPQSVEELLNSLTLN